MTAVAAVFLAVAGVVVAGFSLYLLVLAIAAGSRMSPTPHHDAPSTRLAVLVPAHNEEKLVARCVDSLLTQAYPRNLYRVIVIADNCSDETAARACAAGAEVMVRDEPHARGKGHGLRWAMDRVLAGRQPCDAVVVVDADSIADREMLSALEREFAAGHPVAQADYSLIEDGSPRSTMVAAAFLLFHRVRFAGRARLGMAANLVGNGMLFSRGVLEAHPWDAFTGVEDLEYSTRLRLAGTSPRFAPASMVSGPGPATRAGVTRQRLRWEGGRFHVVRTWLPKIIAAAIARRDGSLLDAALDLATPPLGILTVAGAGGTLVTGFAVAYAGVPAWAEAPWLVGLLAIPAFVVVGLRAADASPGMSHAVCLGAPGYLAWKVMTYIRLLHGFDAARWERSDRPNEQPQPRAGRVDVGGVPVDVLDMSGALLRLRTAMKGSRVFQVSTVNLDFVVKAQSDPELRRIFRRSDLNLADGAPVVWLGRLLGANMPGRVAGADLVPALLRDAAQVRGRVFLLGGEGGVASEAGAKVMDLFPGIEVVGTYEPARAAVQNMNNAEILARIDAARPDLLLVAFGHPKQELWIDMHRDRLRASVAIGVGCVFDLIAGRAKRAPRWMQDAGLEWLYRVAHEPRHLAWRYLNDVAWLVLLTGRAARARYAARPLVESA